MNELMNQHHKPIKVIGSLLIVISLVAMFAFLELVIDLRGDAAFINQMGMIRGGTQRLIIQEMTFHHNDILLDQLNQRIEGVGQHLKLMRDPAFHQGYTVLEREWVNVKKAVVDFRTSKDNSQLYVRSEAFYAISDQFVMLAQNHSEQKMADVLVFRPILVLATVPLLIAYVVLLLYSLRLSGRYRRMHHMAYIDTMTGVSNRNHYNVVIEEYRALGNLPDHLYCVFLDLNNLKITNDTLGHDAGNHLLEQFSLIMQGVFKDYGTVFRYGGDEFIALLKGGSLSQMERLVNGIQEKVAHWNGTSVIQISFAYGIASSQESEIESIDSLIETADARMYVAKLKMKSRA